VHVRGVCLAMGPELNVLKSAVGTLQCARLRTPGLPIPKERTRGKIFHIHWCNTQSHKLVQFDNALYLGHAVLNSPPRGSCRSYIRVDADSHKRRTRLTRSPSP
jgi:hypothetical protein